MKKEVYEELIRKRQPRPVVPNIRKIKIITLTRLARTIIIQHIKIANIAIIRNSRFRIKLLL